MKSNLRYIFHNHRLLIGIISCIAAIGWAIVMDPLSIPRQVSSDPSWLWSRLAPNIGVELLFLSGSLAFFNQITGARFRFDRYCCALGLALIYGAALKQGTGGSVFVCFSPSLIFATIFLIRTRQN